MPRRAPERRPISSGRAVKSGIRMRPGFTLRLSLSRPSSAASANSDSGFEIVEAKTRLSPIDTSVAMINICNTRSRSLRTILSISPAALVIATTPTALPLCTTGVATLNKVLPSAPRLSWTCVCPERLPSTKARSCSSTDCCSLPKIEMGEDKKDQIADNPSPINVFPSPSFSSPATVVKSACPSI